LNTKVANGTAEQDSKKENKENKAGAEKDDPSVIYKVSDVSKG